MNCLYLIILFPIVGYFFLAFSNGQWSEKYASCLGIGTIALSLITTIVIGIFFFNQSSEIFIQDLWNWISINNFKIKCNLLLDSLSFTMIVVVTGVGFLIHVFSAWYMHGEKGYSRFFAYTNLFIASMLILVLADNLLFMYLGWEGVGLCSYLLIGFYYTNEVSGNAAIKAFIITRLGDVLLALALFMIYDIFGTLSIYQLNKIVLAHHMLPWITVLILGAAVAKSAQLPLQTWLTDAMVGPTPVSALIHAATMVTAGVYLITRTHHLFLLTPGVLHYVGIIGAITLLMAAFSALVQTDIKRILAYSTMSQLGYMFLALGVKAWNAAILHLMIHAFFKALLFLSAGSIILACHHEQNIFKMGGLRKHMPLIHLCFLIGGSSLAALPLITSGFYSKDEIIFRVWQNGDITFIFCAFLGTLLTSLYIFRLIFLVFYGQEKKQYIHIHKSVMYYLPLIVLLLLSTFLGTLIKLPLSSILPLSNKDNNNKIIIEIFSSIITILGLLIAYFIWCNNDRLLTFINRNTVFDKLKKLFFTGWGFDWLYYQLFVKSYLVIVKVLKNDPINSFINNTIFFVIRIANKRIRITENGYIRWYIASMMLGAIIIFTLMLC